MSDLRPLPAALKAEKWDAVRTVLKIQCGKLWALGEAQNPIVQFAKSGDEPELFELAESLSTALQVHVTYGFMYVTYDCMHITYG